MEPEVLSSSLRGGTIFPPCAASSGLAEPPAWDPRQSIRFEAERDRDALDLSPCLPGDFAPREIGDPGCGTGQDAALLQRRHPEALVYGLDSSPELLARARVRMPGTSVNWMDGDIAAWARPCGRI